MKWKKREREREKAIVIFLKKIRVLQDQKPWIIKLWIISDCFSHARARRKFQNNEATTCGNSPCIPFSSFFFPPSKDGRGQRLVDRSVELTREALAYNVRVCNRW